MRIGIFYKDFFDPPPRPLGKDKKGKGKGKGRPAPTDDDATPTPAAPVTIDTAAPMPKKKRSVRFSNAVKVKLIAPRGSEFDKLVNKFGWEKAEEMFKEMEQAKAAAGEVDEEDGEDDGMPMESDEEMEGGDEEMEDAEMLSGEEDEDEDEGDEEEDEFESDDDEGQETIERLKASLFDEEDDNLDDGASPGQFSTFPASAASLIFSL
jgi:U3 small nucleolar RNA-associated protein MPP10